MYFHALASYRIGKKVLTKFKVNGSSVNGIDNISRAIRMHFRDHFKQKELPFITLPWNSFCRIPPDKAAELKAIPCEAEILEAIKSCDPSKASDYDGFNLKFLLKMWDVIADDVLSFVRNFFQNGSCSSSINTTWITLIPKMEQASSIDDYRPISMVGCLYKIIAKVLARRLWSVMGLIISESQTGFIEGRNITDGLITAHSAVSWLKRRRKPGAIFKIDFKKAYDSMRLSFLKHMLL